MAGPAPLTVGVPSALEVVAAVLLVVVALLRWQSLSGEFSPRTLLGEYRAGKRSARESDEE